MIATLRRAGPADAAAITRVHIASWKTTYGPLLPPEVVVERTRWDVRLPLWEGRLRGGRCVIVAEDAGEMLGFVSAGPMPARPQEYEPLPAFAAYLEGLYLLAGRQRTGLGRVLVRAVARELQAAGMGSLALHVLATNPARGFYERLGAQFLRDEPEETAHGATWHQCAYGWPDIRVVAE